MIADLRNEISRLKHKITDEPNDQNEDKPDDSWSNSKKEPKKLDEHKVPNGKVIEPNVIRGKQNGELLASLEEEDEEEVVEEDKVNGEVKNRGIPLELQEDIVDKQAPGKVRKFREQIVSTFREQMRLRYYYS